MINYAVREAGPSRHHGAQLRSPTETPLTSDQYCTDGYKVAAWIEFSLFVHFVKIIKFRKYL